MGKLVSVLRSGNLLLGRKDIFLGFLRIAME
jgi:hypothetical protein